MKCLLALSGLLLIFLVAGCSEGQKANPLERAPAVVEGDPLNPLQKMPIEKTKE